MSKHISSSLVIIILIITILSPIKCLLTCQLDLSDNIANNPSTYTLTLSKSSSSTFTFSASNVIIMTLPSDYSVTAGTTLVCSATITSSMESFPVDTTPTCTVAILNQIKITNTFDQDYTGNTIEIVITISTIYNPKFTKPTGYFNAVIQTSTSDSTQVDAIAPSTINIDYLQPSTMKACAFRVSSPIIVGNSATYNLNITTGSVFPSGGYVKIQFPSWNSNNPYPTPDQKWMPGTTTTCSADSSVAIPNVANTVACTTDTSTGIVTITGAWTSDTTGSSYISILNVKNPLSIISSGTFSITTYDSSNYQIETCTAAGITPDTPDTLTSCTFSCTNNKVSGTDSCKLSFRTKNSLKPTVKFTIQLPPQITAGTGFSISGNTQNILSSSVGMTSSGGVYILNSPVSLSVTYIPSNTNLTFTLSPVILPSSMQATSSFQVYSLVNGNNVDSITSGFVYSASVPGSFTSITIRANPTTIQATAIYTFILTPNDAIPSGSTNAGFRIYFPSDITVPSSGTCTYTVSGVQNTPTCTYNSVAGTVIIPTGVVTYPITITISGLINPNSVRTTGTFTIQSLVTINDLTSIQDQGTQTCSGYTSGSISSFIVSVQTSQAYTSRQATYTFTFTIGDAVPDNGRISLTIQSPIVISNTGITSSSFSAITTTTLYSNPSVGISGSGTYTITLSNALKSQNSGASISFSLGSITNPPTTQPAAAFQVQTMDASGNLIDTYNTYASIQVSSETYSSVYVNPQTTINGASGYYTITFIIKTIHYSTDTFTISYPSNIDPGNTITCTGSADTTILTISSCTVDTNTRIITIIPSNFPQTNAGKTITFTVNNFKNIGYSNSIGDFTINTIASTTYIREMGTYTLSTQLTPATLSAASYVASPNIIEDPSSYIFSITPTNIMPSNGKIKVVFPSEYTITNSMSISCTPITNLNTVTSCIPDSSTNSILVTATGYPTDTSLFKFQIQSISNPVVSTSTTSFRIYTLTSSGNIIDRIETNLFWNADCTLPCKTCNSPTSKTTCYTCYQGSGSTLTLLNKLTSTCVSTCPSGTMQSGGQYCEICQSPCSTCSGSLTTCTSCVNSYLLSNSACYNVCPQGKYQDTNNNICVSCATGCLECSSLTNCIACNTNSGYRLYSGTCVQTCPASITVDNGISCQSCANGCATCSTTTSNCPTCLSGYYSDSGACITSCTHFLYVSQSKCVSQCPDGTYLSGSNCLDCQSPCQTCSGSATTCLTCKSNYYLSGSQCVSSCSSGTYANTNSGLCTACSTGCLVCTSATSCSTCNTASGYKLYQSQCYSSCPSSTTIDNGIECKACDTGCASCSTTTSNCPTCQANYYSYNNGCVSSCPSGLFVNSGSCVSCESPCATCSTTKNTCTSCVSGSTPYLLGTTCVSSCPTGQSPNTSGVCTTTTSSSSSTGSTSSTGNSTTITITQADSSASLVPFPWVIASFLCIIGLVGIKATYKETVLSSNLLALCSVFEFGSWVTFGVLLLYNSNWPGFSTIFSNISFKNNLDLILIFGAIALHFVNNLIFLFIQLTGLATDLTYQKWINEQKTNNACHLITIIFSLLIGFRIQRLLYNKLAEVKCFSASFTSIQQIQPIHILTIWHLISASTVASASAVIFLINHGLSVQQISFSALEVLIMFSICMTLTFCDIRKPKTFFERMESAIYKQVPEESGLGGSLVQAVTNKNDSMKISPDNVVLGIDENGSKNQIDNSPFKPLIPQYQNIPGQTYTETNSVTESPFAEQVNFNQQHYADNIKPKANKGLRNPIRNNLTKVSYNEEEYTLPHDNNQNTITDSKFPVFFSKSKNKKPINKQNLLNKVQKSNELTTSSEHEDLAAVFLKAKKAPKTNKIYPMDDNRIFKGRNNPNRESLFNQKSNTSRENSFVRLENSEENRKYPGNNEIINAKDLKPADGNSTDHNSTELASTNMGSVPYYSKIAKPINTPYTILDSIASLKEYKTLEQPTKDEICLADNLERNQIIKPTDMLAKALSNEDPIPVTTSNLPLNTLSTNKNSHKVIILPEEIDKDKQNTSDISGSIFRNDKNKKPLGVKKRYKADDKPPINTIKSIDSLDKKIALERKDSIDNYHISEPTESLNNTLINQENKYKDEKKKEDEKEKEDVKKNQDEKKKEDEIEREEDINKNEDENKKENIREKENEVEMIKEDTKINEDEKKKIEEKQKEEDKNNEDEKKKEVEIEKEDIKKNEDEKKNDDIREKENKDEMKKVDTQLNKHENKKGDAKKKDNQKENDDKKTKEIETEKEKEVAKINEDKKKNEDTNQNEIEKKIEEENATPPLSTKFNPRDYSMDSSTVHIGETKEYQISLNPKPQKIPQTITCEKLPDIHYEPDWQTLPNIHKKLPDSSIDMTTSKKSLKEGNRSKKRDSKINTSQNKNMINVSDDSQEEEFNTSGEYINEDTPSNYNLFNQRYDDEVQFNKMGINLPKFRLPPIRETSNTRIKLPPIYNNNNVPAALINEPSKLYSYTSTMYGHFDEADIDNAAPSDFFKGNIKPNLNHNDHQIPMKSDIKESNKNKITKQLDDDTVIIDKN